MPLFLIFYSPCSSPVFTELSQIADILSVEFFHGQTHFTSQFYETVQQVNIWTFYLICSLALKGKTCQKLEMQCRLEYIFVSVFKCLHHSTNENDPHFHLNGRSR